MTEALVAGWLLEQERREGLREEYLAPTTTAVLRRNIRVWLRFLGTVARTDDPQPATVAAFRAWAMRTRYGGTVNLLLAGLRSLYRWAVAAGLREIDITLGHGHHPSATAGSERDLPALSEPEFARVLGAIAGTGLRARRDRALLWLLHGCAVDSIALARATVGDVDLRLGRMRLLPRWRPSLWRRGRRATPDVVCAVPPAAQVHLASYLELRRAPGDRDPLFTDAQGRRGLSTLGMRLVVLRALMAAGLRHGASGLQRHDRMHRYPVLQTADVALKGTEMSLPSSTPERERTLALLHLLAALPQARVAWERVRVGDVDTAAGCLRIRRSGGRRGGVVPRELTLPMGATTALRHWLATRPDAGADEPLFPDPGHGGQASHHTLKRWAWAAFPERLPPASRALGPGRSTRRLRPE